MTSRLALHPDLDECLLEDRVLLYAGPGLYASQFIPSSGMTPSFVVSGFQTGNTGPGSGGAISPGPQFFYLQIGLNSSANGGVRLGGAFSVFNPPQTLPTVQGPAVGSGPGSGGRGGASNASGYGGAISSGYNTALSSSNNYGMGTTALGSITAHVSGTTDQLVEAQATANPETATSAAEGTNAPAPPPPNSGQGPFSPQDRLLGKGLGNSGGLLIGPGMNAPAHRPAAPRP